MSGFETQSSQREGGREGKGFYTIIVDYVILCGCQLLSLLGHSEMLDILQ